MVYKEREIVMQMLLIAFLILMIIAYFVQKSLVVKLYNTKGVNLSAGRIISVLASLGIYGPIGLYFEGAQGGRFLTWLGFSAILCIPTIFLLVRNIKGAGVGMGILLTILQALSGLLILVFGVFALATGASMAQFSTDSGIPATKAQKKAAKKRADQKKAIEHEQDAAMAEHYGYTSTRDAAEAGIIPGTRENMEDK